MTPNIFARLVPLPAKVKAVTLTDDCVTFAVLVNANLCEESRRRAFRHELNHIYNDHFFEQCLGVAELERLADEITKTPSKLECLDDAI